MVATGVEGLPPAEMCKARDPGGARAARLPPAQTDAPHGRAFHPLSGSPARSRKRCRKVLYPPVVRRYLPVEEKCQGQRLLFLLLAVVSVQVYSASENQEDAMVSCSVPETGAPRCPPAGEGLEDHWQREAPSADSLAPGQLLALASTVESPISLDITELWQGTLAKY
ncbi:radiation-inducible immediate-early gene IEX-1 [Rhinatrema bivittatum]|uniref:radiation-inducible immediate-early gene IEX-1 n=1 Tax=Rhinatrema bivittatum TaxID=194408 RepID=UPI001127A82D|nr:radiation-inducible immediate-early gene IEX-1 [Rhinatrema bivittatum]